ncbi:AsmA family protein [Nitrosomonas sp.]|uniref:AsmA family protein n=1 Tax=Nitrosomonas sp. TaxID=42353 RepID=UPI0033058C2A
MSIVKWIGIVFLISILLFILLISAMNWNWARDWAAQQISELTHRKLTITGDLTVNWSLAPHIRIEQIQFANAAWSKEPNMLELAAVDLNIDLLELLKGRVIFPEIALTKPSIILEKSREGEANWEFQVNKNEDDRSEFPVIERLRIQSGHLVYRDLLNNTDISTAFKTTEGQTDGTDATQLQAEGKLNGQPLSIFLNAGPLVALREANEPYPMVLELQAGKTTIKVDGTVLAPLQLKGIDLQFDMKGPNPEQLSQIVQLPLPNLPPYHLKGDFSHREDEGIWQIKSLQGHVGDSDLAGDIDVKIVEGQPRIKADLISKKIDLDDLGPLIGLAPDTGAGETASKAQQKEAEKEAARPLIFPDKPIGFEKLRNINADIKLRSKQVESKLPVDDLYMHAIIDDGHLILSPLDFGVADGHIRSHVEVDTRTHPVKSKIESEIHHVQLNEILRRFEIADQSAGLIGGKAIYWFKGNSVEEMLASADGGLLMLMTGGHFDDLLVELAGLDIGEAVVALFDKDDNTEINCAFVDLPANSGIMNLSTFVVDTEDTIFLGAGSLDLRKESLDLVIDPKPKDLSLFSARAPLHIEGSFKKPTFIPGASAILRGAVSLALLPAAPIVSLYALLQKDQKEQKDKKNDKQENTTNCTGLVNAINEAHEENQ